MKFLSEADVRILKRVIRDVLNQQIGDAPFTQHNSNQASDVYIARVPTGGIPALTIGSPDVPGVAECDIYRIAWEGTGTGDIGMEAMTGVSRLVFNLSTTIINSRYCIVNKTKGGPWVAQDIGSSELTGTGGCISSIDGVDLSGLTEASLVETGTATGQLEYLLGIDGDGCMVRVPWRKCSS